MTTEKAELALKKLREVTELDKKMRELNKVDLEVLNFILKKFSDEGKPPKKEEIMDSLSIGLFDVIQSFSKLNEFEFISLMGAEITAASPFSAMSTQYEVFYDGRGVFATSALDSLTVPLLVERDAGIKSCCDYCKEKVEIEVKEGKIGSSSPEELWVLIEIIYDDCIGRERCSKNVFSDKQHFSEGLYLTLDEALFVAKELFHGRMI